MVSENYDFIDFNSHAHVERDLCRVLQRKEHKISTHTLTWSVTFEVVKGKNYGEISTHTLTWSVTLKATETPYTQHISTHTLTWSVTSLSSYLLTVI